jgi:putative sigma-54 modulation protein
MRLEFSGKNLALTDALRSKAENKIGKLERFTGPIVSAHASFEVERHMHHVDLMVHCTHDRIYKARGVAEDMYLAVNAATDAIEQQAKKEKDKRLAGRGKGSGKSAAPGSPAEEAGEEDEESHGPGRRRPAVKRRPDLYSPKPLALRDAVLLLGEEKLPVLVFRDSDMDRLMVIFKDREGRVHLVEPPMER